MVTTDALIVGGGPAGLAAAIAVRLRGIDALVVDYNHPPIDKACGEGLMPEGVRLLGELGVALSRDEAVEFMGIRFISGSTIAEGRFPKRAGLGIRRTTLHQRLADRAAEVGADLRWRHRIELTEGVAPKINGEPIVCKWIIGADGYESRVRRWANISPASNRRRIGIRQHFRVKPWTDLVELYWHDSGQAYVTPISADEVCVALLGTRLELRAPQIAAFPELAHRLAESEPSSSPRGSVSSSMTLGRVVSGRVALIGDASGTVDSITGEGLSLAFAQAFALADAMDRGDLSLYSAAHRSVCRVAKMGARLLLLMNDYKALRKRAVSALAAREKGFSQFLAVHSGAISPASLSIGNLAGFAWGMLAADT